MVDVLIIRREVFPWAREPKLKLGEVDPEDEFEPFNQLSKVVASRKSEWMSLPWRTGS